MLKGVNSMTKKERIIAAILGRVFDRVPWTMYKSYPPWGTAELRLRNMGLAMIYQHFPIVKEAYEHVEVKEECQYMFDNARGKHIILRRFETPVGEVSTQHVFHIDSLPGPGDLIQKFGSDIDQETLSWVTKHPFENEVDYEALAYLYEHTILEPNFNAFLFTEQIIGSEGVIFANVGKSPFQIMLYELMGIEKCYFELQQHPKEFMRLYEIIYEKQRERIRLAAESPALIVWCPDNVSSALTTPRLFEELSLPFYNEMADILHEHGKVYAVHMDGQLRALAPLIKKTRIDVIEAFTPPPMGDLPVDEALAMWRDKVVWINFPGTLIASADKTVIEDYTLQLLTSVAPGDRFLIGCTESYPLERWEIAFGEIGRTLETYGVYPISCQT